MRGKLTVILTALMSVMLMTSCERLNVKEKPGGIVRNIEYQEDKDCWCVPTDDFKVLLKEAQK